MKREVIDWTWYESKEFKNGGEATPAQIFAIIQEIKDKKYFFVGEDHQDGNNTVPVLSNGKKYLFTRRGWGKLMAIATNHFGPYDYASYTDIVSRDYFKYRKKPSNNDIAQGTKVKKLSILNETFKIEVKEDEFLSILESEKIGLPYEKPYGFLDKNDFVVLKTNKKHKKFKVKKVEANYNTMMITVYFK